MWIRLFSEKSIHKQMKILVAGYNTVKNGIGVSGRERLLLEISRKFLDNGIVVDAFFGNLKGKNASFLKPVSFLFGVLNPLIKRINNLIKLPSYKNRYYSELFYDICLRRKICGKYDYIITTNPWIPKTARKAKMHKIEIILLAGNPSDNLIFDLIRIEKSKINLVNNYDAFDFIKRLNKYNEFAVNVDKVITINEFTANTFQQDQYFQNSIVFNVNLVQSIIISQSPNSKLTNEEEFTSTDLNVFYLAHTTTLKGLHYLMETIINLNSSLGLKIKLYIGGAIDPSYSKIVLDKFKKYNFFEFLGPLNNQAKVLYYYNCDIFVCPSIIDMSPATVFEAMANRKPVILTEGCGNKWIIKNKINGFIAKTKDPDDLADKLMWCTTNKHLLQSMGENAFNSYVYYLSQKSQQINRIIDFIIT